MAWLSKQRDSSSSSSSSSFTPNRWSYDVFLSFRGEDTRNNFTGHLYTALCRRGLNTFIDDELRRGEEVAPTLFKTIQESMTSIVVFSENYASSKWCLDELMCILDCKESKNQIVWPIFYKVAPSDVRNQRGSFGEALSRLEANFRMDRVERWKAALTQAASLSGWHFTEGHESKFIHNIVEEISLRTSNRTYLKVAKYPVGLESRVQDMDKLLCVGKTDVRMVGIWGIGGIGKTTIAKAVYGSIAHKFEGQCFLANVREMSSMPNGLVQLQNNLLSEILGGSIKFMVTSCHQGANLIEKRLHNKRVLLVLDDVDHRDQLDNLAGGPDWFGRGSRIIVTTRDKHLLSAHGVTSTYKAKELDFYESSELFSWNSFQRDKPPNDYVKLVGRAVCYTKGLPLALTVLGSHLCGRSIEEWKDALDSYEIIPNKEIQEILKISFNGLEYFQKEVFLDIACFFKGEKKDDIVDILRSCDLFPVISIGVLIDKSLLVINEHNMLTMHDLLEDMGKEIVREESPNEPGERSRLWFHKDVCDVLTKQTGTSKVRGIMINMPEKNEICISAEAFSRMKNLRYLINLNASLIGNIDLPNELRLLNWYKYPLQSLPSNFQPEKLVALKMPSSNISRFGKGSTKVGTLKSMDFSGCEMLEEIPDFTGFPNLEKLFLKECSGLVGIHESVGYLEKLVTLSLQNCSNLTRFPTKLRLKSLKLLNMKGCRMLESFPEIEAGTMVLENINLECCENLRNLPRSIYQLKHLQELEVRGCPKLISFPMKENPENPSSVSHDSHSSLVFPKLRFLRVGDCNLSECDFLMPFNCVSTLTFLDLSGSNFVCLPEWINMFVSLEWLILRDCKKLQEIPQLSPCIKGINTGGCKSLERFSKLSNILEHNSQGSLQYSDLSNCHKLLKSLDFDVEKMASILLGHSQTHQQHVPSNGECYEFSIILPGNDIPKWFGHRKQPVDPNYCDFNIKFPPNFTGKNTRLAFSATFGTIDYTLPYDYDDYERYGFHVRVFINGDEIFSFHEHIISPGSDHVWLQYISLSNMRHWKRYWNEEDIMYKCEVRFLPSEPISLKACGVQLVYLGHGDDVENLGVTTGEIIDENNNPI
ncbi:TMV resistance protein N-like [Prunus avium]|uniref:TMV resistance protein N-like n=1 Tax=Prunus avium TaxID=42229 RepID=A0A6P5RZQ3_PRUAV|nr:TMV resistance protein N-like [Prunus avium]